MTSAALLTSNDRCDRCGAQAFVEVGLSEGTLMFCAHHYREHEDVLRAVTAVINDERIRLRAVS